MYNYEQSALDVRLRISASARRTCDLGDAVQCYLREYRRLKRFAVVQADGSAGVLLGSVFDERDWRIAALETDAGGRRLVDVSTISQVVDQPPQILLRPVLRPIEIGAVPAPRRLETDRLLGCSVLSHDGPAGRVADLLVNIDNWRIKFFVVDNGQRLVLLHVAWATSVEFPSSKVGVDLPAEALLSAPEYAGIGVLTPGYEDVVSRHYTQRDFRI